MTMPAPTPAPPAPPPAPSPAPPADPPAPPAPPTPAPAAFSEEQQAEVSRIAAREKAEGERAATRSIEELLGVKPEEAKAIIDAAREAEAGKLSEAEKALKAATTAQEKADADLALARKIARDAAISVVLTANGVPVELDETGNMKGRAARIVKLLDVGDDADGATITAAVSALKEEEPALFGAATPPAPGAPPRPPSGDPPGNPPGSPPSADGLTRGAARAATANESTKPFDPLKLGKE